MPLFFSLGYQGALNAVQRLLWPTQPLFAHVYDICFVCRPERVGVLYVALQDALRRHAGIWIHCGVLGTIYPTGCDLSEIQVAWFPCDDLLRVTKQCNSGHTPIITFCGPHFFSRFSSEKSCAPPGLSVSSLLLIAEAMSSVTSFSMIHCTPPRPSPPATKIPWTPCRNRLNDCLPDQWYQHVHNLLRHTVRITHPLNRKLRAISTNVTERINLPSIRVESLLHPSRGQDQMRLLCGSKPRHVFFNTGFVGSLPPCFSNFVGQSVPPSVCALIKVSSVFCSTQFNHLSVFIFQLHGNRSAPTTRLLPVSHMNGLLLPSSLIKLE